MPRAKTTPIIRNALESRGYAIRLSREFRTCKFYRHSAGVRSSATTLHCLDSRIRAMLRAQVNTSPSTPVGKALPAKIGSLADCLVGAEHHTGPL
jgi:hypothetical protein